MKRLTLTALLFVLLFSSCEQVPDPNATQFMDDNGPFSGTAWSVFAAHVYSGPLAGDHEFNGSDKIVIDAKTTTFTGSFWANYKGTYRSYYSPNNPDFVMPTAPRIFVVIGSNETIQVISGSHADFGPIVWVRTYKDGDRMDVYFK
jgi:hypothetical protein